MSITSFKNAGSINVITLHTRLLDLLKVTKNCSSFDIVVVNVFLNTVFVPGDED